MVWVVLIGLSKLECFYFLFIVIGLGVGINKEFYSFIG